MIDGGNTLLMSVRSADRKRHRRNFQMLSDVADHDVPRYAIGVRGASLTVMRVAV
jgi:hypothetical protein